MPRPIYLFSLSSNPHAKSIKSLDIKLLKPQIDFLNYDYLILTSKQACEALKQYNKEEYSHMPSLCTSKKTAEAYERLGGDVLACGNGYGDDLTQIIKTYPHAKKWLYLRAKIVASEFVRTCQDDGYSIDEIVVYESRCSDEILDIKVQDDAVLIFTSPSSVECFLKNKTINPHAKIVVIGKTTAAALPKEVNSHMPKERSIESCIALAKNL